MVSSRRQEAQCGGLTHTFTVPAREAFLMQQIFWKDQGCRVRIGGLGTLEMAFLL